MEYDDFKSDLYDMSLTRSLKLLWNATDKTTRHLLLFALGLVAISAALTALAPVLLKEIIDQFASLKAVPGGVTAFFLLISYAACHWLAKSLAEVRAMVHGRADIKVQRRLSSMLLRHILLLPLKFHLDKQTGALHQTLNNGLQGYRMILNHLLLTVLPVGIELTVIGVVLFLIGQSDFLFLIAISVLLYVFAFWRGIVRIGKPASATSSAQINSGSVFTDTLLNFEAIKCFAAEHRMSSRYEDTLQDTEEQSSTLLLRKLENGLIVAAIFTASLGATLFFSAREVQAETMSVGEFVLVNTYMLQLTRPLEMLGFAFRDVTQGIFFTRKMGAIYDERQEAQSATRCVATAPWPPRLAFENVSFAYRPPNLVLKDVSFVGPPGKTVAIVGASGSGKSTIVRLLTRLLEPSAGQIYLNDVPLSQIAPAQLRRAIAVVPQDCVLLNGSIGYNISIGKDDCSEADVIRAAKLASLHDWINALPNGYETLVGERGANLSGGERQRLAIARAAVRRPSVLVFDEATSALDGKTEQMVFCNVFAKRTKATTVLIAHRLINVVDADVIVVLDRGSVAEIGTHTHLLEQEKAYASLWRIQRQEEGFGNAEMRRSTAARMYGLS